jgi:hypothetical protein
VLQNFVFEVHLEVQINYIKIILHLGKCILQMAAKLPRSVFASLRRIVVRFEKEKQNKVRIGKYNKKSSMKSSPVKR